MHISVSITSVRPSEYSSLLVSSATQFCIFDFTAVGRWRVETTLSHYGSEIGVSGFDVRVSVRRVYSCE